MTIIRKELFSSFCMYIRSINNCNLGVQYTSVYLALCFTYHFMVYYFDSYYISYVIQIKTIFDTTKGTFNYNPCSQ